MSALGAAVLAGLAAAPGDRPLAVPTRDVDVVYRTVATGAAPALEQRVRWDVAAGRQRVDPPMPGLYLIFDYRAHRLTSVRDSIRAVLQVDGYAASLDPAAGAGRYTRTGAASVAGLSCTLWQADDGASDTRHLCVTDDGVLLQLSAGSRVLVEAVSVRYGPADPTAFIVPAGYRRIVPGQEKTP